MNRRRRLPWQVVAAFSALLVLWVPFVLVEELAQKVEYRWVLLKHHIQSGDADYRARGNELYQVHCSACHGVDGNGGRGPRLDDLVSQGLRRDVDMFNLIRGGVREGGMPGFDGILDLQETLQVTAFVRNLGRARPSLVAGDPARGERVFRAQGCLACHSLAAEGGAFGPDLMSVGRKRGADYLRQKVIAPQDIVPPEYRSINAEDKDGGTYMGLLVAEDTFSVQFRDPSGRLHSYRKDELSSWRVESGRSLMPGYAESLTAAQLDDLVAYLSGLGREQ